MRMVLHTSPITRTLRVLALILVAGWGCDQTRTTSGETASGFSVRITGSFPVCTMDTIRVYLSDGFSPRVILAAPVQKKGNEAVFTLQGTVPGQGLYLVGVAPNNLIPVILGNEKAITMGGNCANLRRYGKISDSPVNEAYRGALDALGSFQTLASQADQRHQMALQSGSQALEAEAVALRQQVWQGQKRLLDSLRQVQPFVAKLIAPVVTQPFDPANNPKGYTDELDHLAGSLFAEVNLQDPDYERASILADYTRSVVQAWYSTGDTDRAGRYLDSLLSRLPDNAVRKNCLAGAIYTLDQIGSPAFVTYANRYLAAYTPTGQERDYLTSRAETYREAAEAEKLLGIGAVPPDITLPDPQGRTFSLSSLRGKVVLLDFWASWCKPCRMENPNVVRVYQAYKDKGFDILSVSLDRTQDAWVQAIAQDRMTWHHVSDLKFWQSEAAQLYRVSSIPATFLLDRQGRIVAKNLRGPALEAKVAELLGS